MTIYSAADLEFLRRPHVARAWFGEFFLPGSTVRMHSGCGTVTVGGHDWKGVTDPGGSQLVGLREVPDARFGMAAKIDIVIAGIDSAFVKSMKETARDVEGTRANIYWCMFDQETLEPWSSGLKKRFPGYLSAPKIVRSGIGERYLAYTVESFWQSMDFPWGGLLNDASQQRRYPGDLGLEYIGVQVNEVINA